MSKILILFAHPAFERSRVHKGLLGRIENIPGVTVNDLYEHYPDFDIDVAREQDLLLKHDLIIFQHPFYWYSTPALVKQWQDLVLEHGWAYGTEGRMLTGKKVLNAISSGGSAMAYQETGYNRHTIREFLLPIEQTVRLCNMSYLPPYIVHGTHKMSEGDILLEASRYEELIMSLREDRLADSLMHSVPILNDLFPLSSTLNS